MRAAVGICAFIVIRKGHVRSGSRFSSESRQFASMHRSNGCMEGLFWRPLAMRASTSLLISLYRMRRTSADQSRMPGPYSLVLQRRLIDQMRRTGSLRPRDTQQMPAPSRCAQSTLLAPFRARRGSGRCLRLPWTVDLASALLLNRINNFRCNEFDSCRSEARRSREILGMRPSDRRALRLSGAGSSAGCARVARDRASMCQRRRRGPVMLDPSRIARHERPSLAST